MITNKQFNNMEKVNEFKMLYDVSEQDAIEIIRAGYPNFFLRGRWTLVDASEDIKEPCKKLIARSKWFVFWFFDNCIDIDLMDDDGPSLDNNSYDVKLACYIKAYELGYYVKELHEYFSDKKNTITNDHL